MYRTVPRVITAIVRNWTFKVIVWPYSAETVCSITEGFCCHRGLQMVLGAIDRSHIPIKAPRLNEESYINRKNFHSVVLQATCNHRMMFTDRFAGFPGSTHDARVLRNSDLFDRISESKDTIFPGGSFILGDSAYPLSAWQLTPYRDNRHLTFKQRNYNYLHSSTRMVIQRIFALLKGRFRRLKYMDIDRVEDFPNIILAACTLHNICLMSEGDVDDLVDDDAIGMDEDSCDPYNNVATTICSAGMRNEGKVKRDLRAEQLWEQCRVLLH